MKFIIMIDNDRVYFYQSYSLNLQVCKLRQVYAKVQFFFYVCRYITLEYKIYKTSAEVKKKAFWD